MHNCVNAETMMTTCQKLVDYIMTTSEIREKLKVGISYQKLPSQIGWFWAKIGNKVIQKQTCGIFRKVGIEHICAGGGGSVANMGFTSLYRRGL